MFYNQDKTSWYKGDWVRNNREGWGVRWYVQVKDLQPVGAFEQPDDDVCVCTQLPLR